MTFRLEESVREPGRLSSFLRVNADVSSPQEIEAVENDVVLPAKDSELLKGRRKKKLDDEDYGGGAGATNRLFGDGIKFDVSSLEDPLRLDDPRLQTLFDPGGSDEFHLRNELNFDLETVQKLRSSQDPKSSAEAEHDLQWLEAKLEASY
jgi:hypothetical protein